MDTIAAKHRAVLARYLPEAAVEWVFQYLNRHRIHLRIARERLSKLGDYRPPHTNHEQHSISVAGNLPPHFFLWVFLHEAAHLETHLSHPTAAPHGYEWQRHYATLLSAHADWFPAELQPLILRYSNRIPLHRTLGRQIEHALRSLDTNHAPLPILDQQQPGTLFRLANRTDRLFRALEKRRTRWLCLCLNDKRQYLVSGTAEIVIEC